MFGWFETTTLKIIAIHRYKGIEIKDIYKSLFKIMSKRSGIDVEQKINDTIKKELEGLKAFQKAWVKRKSVLQWIDEDKELKYLFNMALEDVLTNNDIDFESFQMDLYYEYQNLTYEMREEKLLAGGYNYNK